MHIMFLGLILFTMNAGHPIAILPRFDHQMKLQHDGMMLPHRTVIMFGSDANATTKNWTIHKELGARYYVVLGQHILTFDGSGGNPTIPDEFLHVKTDSC